MSSIYPVVSHLVLWNTLLLLLVYNVISVCLFDQLLGWNFVLKPYYLSSFNQFGDRLVYTPIVLEPLLGLFKMPVNLPPLFKLLSAHCYLFSGGIYVDFVVLINITTLFCGCNISHFDQDIEEMWLAKIVFWACRGWSIFIYNYPHGTHKPIMLLLWNNYWKSAYTRCLFWKCLGVSCFKTRLMLVWNSLKGGSRQVVYAVKADEGSAGAVSSYMYFYCDVWLVLSPVIIPSWQRM